MPRCGASERRMGLPTPHLSEIPDEGLHVECAVLPEEIKLVPDDAVVRGELAVSMDLLKSGKEVHARGTIAGTFVRQCVRCLAEYEEEAEIPFSGDFRDMTAGPSPLPGKRTSGGTKEPPARVPEDEEDADWEDEPYPLVAGQVEPADMLREYVILAEPMQPLCRPDCAGLCPVCGGDRNQRACGCPEARPASPFEVLKTLREQKKR